MVSLGSNTRAAGSMRADEDSDDSDEEGEGKWALESLSDDTLSEDFSDSVRILRLKDERGVLHFAHAPERFEQFLDHDQYAWIELLIYRASGTLSHNLPSTLDLLAPD